MRVYEIVDKLLFPYNYVTVFNTDLQKFVWQGEAACMDFYRDSFVIDTIEIDNGVLRLNAHPDRDM